jgi:charged multivesicular body protein 5
MQDEMMDVSNEIQETLGRSYNIPDDVDEEELMGGMEAVISSLLYDISTCILRLPAFHGFWHIT